MITYATDLDGAPADNAASEMQVSTMHMNGRDVVRVLLSQSCVYAMGSLHYAMLSKSHVKGIAKRNGTRTFVANAITGIAGQVAATVMLRAFGLNARVLALTLWPDSGFDVVIEAGEVQATIEVKTSLFDGRGSEALRLGDRMPITRKACEPDLYVWVVCSPTFFTADHIYADIVAVLPAGLATSGFRKKGIFPGVRLDDIPPKFSAAWLVESFSALVDPRIASKQAFWGCAATSVQDVLCSAPIRSELFGGRDLFELDGTHQSEVLDLAERTFAKLRRSPESLVGSTPSGG